MKKTIIIKKNYEFKYFFRKGNYFPGSLLEIFTFKNSVEINKIGFVVSRKVGGSVIRNRIKRYMRAAYTEIEESLTENNNILIIWKKKINPQKANFFDVKDDLLKIFKRAEIIEEKE